MGPYHGYAWHLASIHVPYIKKCKPSYNLPCHLNALKKYWPTMLKIQVRGNFVQ